MKAAKMRKAERLGTDQYDQLTERHSIEDYVDELKQKKESAKKLP